MKTILYTHLSMKPHFTLFRGSEVVAVCTPDYLFNADAKDVSEFRKAVAIEQLSELV